MSNPSKIEDPTPADEQKKLDMAFEYLYQTYFGDKQIEKDEISQLPKLLSDVDIFVDVGASLGMYTYYANQCMRNSKIIAIEADPDRYEELNKNCKKWSNEHNNTIEAIYSAAGDSEEAVTFFKTQSHISGGIFQISERAKNFVKVTSPQLILDKLLSEALKQDKKCFVKIDVEGAELRVLLGSKRLIESGNSSFAVGIHSWGDKERKKGPMSVLAYMFNRRMTVSKTCNTMTSNYLFTPSSRNTFNLFVNYTQYVPLLLARQLYRKWFPRSVAQKIELFLNGKRRKRIMNASNKQN